MTPAEKIRRLRKSIGLTQTELGEKLGVKKNAVSKWETGRVEDIPMPQIKAMAKLFGVSASYLVDDNETNVGAPYNPTHRIPILGRISAGLPLYAEQHIEGYTYTELNHGGEYFALRVSGDSMTAARISEGDILIVRRQDIVENGEIAVVMVNGDEATVKRFHREDDTVTLSPQSYNPEHQPQVYNIKKTPIRILGRVVQNQISY